MGNLFQNIKYSSQENQIVHKRTVSFTENHRHLPTAGVNGTMQNVNAVQRMCPLDLLHIKGEFLFSK